MPNYNNHALFANGAGNRISIQVIEMNLYYRCTPCTRKALKLRPHILGIAPSMEGTVFLCGGVFTWCKAVRPSITVALTEPRGEHCSKARTAQNNDH